MHIEGPAPEAGSTSGQRLIDGKRRLNHRIFLHGDVAGTGLAFCRICDRFLPAEHLERHGGENVELYESAVAALESLSKSARVVRGKRENLIAAAIKRDAVRA